MFFSVINKNLNWEILTENLFTFKRWDRVKMNNINMGVHPILRGDENQYIEVNYLKMGVGVNYLKKRE